MGLLEKELSSIVTSHDLFTCSEDTPLGDIVKEMAAKDLGSVCIVDEQGTAIGIFTERDFLKKVGLKAGEAVFKEPIKNYMTPNPKTAKENLPIRHCFGLMRMGRFRHLIVTDEQGVAKRMISLRDGFFFLCDEI